MTRIKLCHQERSTSWRDWNVTTLSFEILQTVGFGSQDLDKRTEFTECMIPCPAKEFCVLPGAALFEFRNPTEIEISKVERPIDQRWSDLGLNRKLKLVNVR